MIFPNNKTNLLRIIKFMVRIVIIG